MIGPEVILYVSVSLCVLFGYLYSRERDRSRDYATDLSQLIHDYDLDSRDLRRSLRHKEIRAEVERNYDEEVIGWIDEHRGEIE